MTGKECTWIRYDEEEVVPKVFVENHTDGNCISKEEHKKALDKQAKKIFKLVDTYLDEVSGMVGYLAVSRGLDFGNIKPGYLEIKKRFKLK